jgi:Lrp/AsnC family transcriptional regulator, leucine-responsive regulatory protein
MATKANVEQGLDAKDRNILSLIQRDGKMSQALIAQQVGLSTAAVNERLKKLEQSGGIRRFTALVDPKSVGIQVTAFIEVFIEHPRYEEPFLKRILELDEVQECHHITGEFSLLLKVRVRDMESLQRLVISQLNGAEGVRQTRTVMVLSTVKEESYIPTGATGEKK